MINGYQYNEAEIINRFFAGKTSGYVVEIGAADGLDNSNSFRLINDLGWYGLLVEPHPGYFMDLLLRYTNNKRVKLSNYAIASTVSRRRLNLDDQCSSLVYPKPQSIEVQCVPLDYLFELYDVPGDFAFLSVDCEGADMEVLGSMDWSVVQPKLVCVEHSMPAQTLTDYMMSVGYKYFDRTKGNTFFIPQ